MNIADRIIIKITRYARVMEFKSRTDEWRKQGIISEDAVFHINSSLCNLNKDIKSLIIGKHSHIRGGVFVYHHGRLEIGDYCYVGDNTQIWSYKNIRIGNRVLIAHNVNIVDNISHPLDAGERHEQYRKILTEGFPDIDLDGKDIIIEDDAWINENTVIMRGVRIGEGAIVGAASVVTHDVPPFTFACGNPAKVIKRV